MQSIISFPDYLKVRWSGKVYFFGIFKYILYITNSSHVPVPIVFKASTHKRILIHSL